jgi:maltooligosyltrehalose trehalohydrolase
MRRTVWAPRAERAELVLEDGERLAMEPAGDGCFQLESVRLVPGRRYRVSLDGGPPLPDPRSSFQPDGVEGTSELVDEEFAWTDAGWSAPPLRDAIVYELHVGTFSPEGTFEGVVRRLDHLTDLGVNAVELMPVAEFPGRWGWGYDGVNLYAVRAAYGGPDGLRRLVDACHRRGVAVILDAVYNHLGPAGNHLDQFGPYFSDRYRTPWGSAVNFDGPGSDGVRDFVAGNVRRWLRDFHLDGLRLDAVHAIHDESARHIVEQLAETVEALEAALGRRLWLILEMDRNDPRGVWPRARGGWGATAHWADDFHHALHAALTGERSGYYGDFHGWPDVVRVLSSPYLYTGQHSTSRDRRHGREPVGTSGERFVVCLQNHDQVGNRAHGERLSRLTTPPWLRVAALLLLTSPYVPLLFAGEEWAASTPFLYFSDHEPELGRKITEGRRAEFARFGWDPAEVPDPQAESTFTASRLRWEERADQPHAAMLDWYQALIRLRRDHPELGCGDFRQSRVMTEAGSQWVVVERGSHLIGANLSQEQAAIRAPGWETAQPLAMTGDATCGDGTLRLGPESAAVWWRERESIGSGTDTVR